MKNENHQNLDCKTARDISIIDTLQRLGFYPEKTKEKECWFLSPFRSEKTPSFKVDLKLNRWYDHGEAIGGNVIDLVIKISGYTIKETLEFLSNSNSFSFQKSTVSVQDLTPNYTIEKVIDLENDVLLWYLIKRRITARVALTYCQEIHYTINGKTYFAIAFKNDVSGYEIRNKYFKGCLGKKEVTHFNNGNQKLLLFEGFLDFLSYKELFSRNKNEDYLILNSISKLKNCWTILSKYSHIDCYLDNDDAGKKTTNLIMEKFSFAQDCSSKYEPFKDVNDYLVEVS